MKTTRWDALRKGDIIACPADGLAEKVTFVRPYVTGKRTIRTSRHDHFKPGTHLVDRLHAHGTQS